MRLTVWAHSHTRTGQREPICLALSLPPSLPPSLYFSLSLSHAHTCTQDNEFLSREDNFRTGVELLAQGKVHHPTTTLSFPLSFSFSFSPSFYLSPPTHPPVIYMCVCVCMYVYVYILQVQESIRAFEAEVQQHPENSDAWLSLGELGGGGR
jgi:hypothetical protein